MYFQPRRPPRALASLFAFFLICCCAQPSLAAEKQRLRVDDYVIDAELAPHAHKLTARAKMKITALDDLSVATFELHNALSPPKTPNATGKPLTAQPLNHHAPTRDPFPVR